MTGERRCHVCATVKWIPLLRPHVHYNADDNNMNDGNNPHLRLQETNIKNKLVRHPFLFVIYLSVLRDNTQGLKYAGIVIQIPHLVPLDAHVSTTGVLAKRGFQLLHAHHKAIVLSINTQETVILIF